MIFLLAVNKKSYENTLDGILIIIIIIIIIIPNFS
jgi:hypothetical protein